MTNTAKMTQEKALVFALELDEIQSNVDVANKLTDMLNAVRNKKANKSMTKVQVRNEELKGEIIELMAENTLYTCTQIVKLLDTEDVVSTQKASALLYSLKDEGKVEVIKDKKATYYKRVV